MLHLFKKTQKSERPAETPQEAWEIFQMYQQLPTRERSKLARLIAGATVDSDFFTEVLRQFYEDRLASMNCCTADAPAADDGVSHDSEQPWRIDELHWSRAREGAVVVYPSQNLPPAGSVVCGYLTVCGETVVMHYTNPAGEE